MKIIAAIPSLRERTAELCKHLVAKQVNQVVMIEGLGWNMYMTPEQAARGLTLMQNYPDRVEDLLEDYRDLTEFKIFKNDSTPGACR